VLTRRVFVLRVFDANAHLFKGQHRLATELARHVVVQEVEVATAIERGRRGRRVE